MLRSANVATPLTEPMDVVPDSVAPAVPVPGVIATATALTKLVTVLPPASWAVTVTAGVMVAPAVVVTGETVNASRLTDPTTTLNGALVAPVRPLADTASV